jgi:hypothetical protein
MALTYPLSPPTGHKSLAKIKLTAWNTVGINASPYSGSQQVYLWPGEGWMLDCALPPLKLADAEPWVAFLMALRGRSGTFLFGDTSRLTTQGFGTGTPLTNGSTAAGATSIVTDGWTINKTGILKAGDYIQITASGLPQRLYKILQDANSDASGNASFDIFPRTREVIPNNTSIVVASCKGTFRLTDNKTNWDVDSAKVYGITFSAIEAI